MNDVIKDHDRAYSAAGSSAAFCPISAGLNGAYPASPILIARQYFARNLSQ
jgi:hypothetical protein